MKMNAETTEKQECDTRKLMFCTWSCPGSRIRCIACETCDKVEMLKGRSKETLKELVTLF